MSKYIQLTSTTKLSELSKIVGPKNVENILVANNIDRTPNIGKAFIQKCADIARSAISISWQKKSTILNTLVGDSDVFEKAALESDDGWKVISALGTFAGMLRIPDTIEIPSSYSTLGDNTPIAQTIYDNAMAQLEKAPHIIDPSVFNEVSTIQHTKIINSGTSRSDFTRFFNLPWGKITLYSTLSDSGIDIPAYPEEYSDSRKANYTQMPDMLYQYEPWQLYESSGPRQNTFEFHLHRDMWTSDHTDEKANELIRYCQANCYPEYNGSAVNVPIVSLYVEGKCLIRGVMTDVSVNWSGPLGSDGWYLEFKLSLSIIEVSETALSHSAIKSKPLIG